MILLEKLDGTSMLNVPQEQTVVTVSDVRSSYMAGFSCRALHSSDYLTGRLVGTVTWDDGRPSDVYSGSGTLTINAARGLRPGNYNVRVQVSDFNIPTPATVSAILPYRVTVTGQVDQKRFVYGPILPKDDGFPNKDQWDFNTGEDNEILASSLKMLLLTNKGERICLPDYGTNLRTVLFEFQASGIEVLIQQEIVDAVTKWEPRVTLQYISVSRPSSRECLVEATFLSKLNQIPFTLVLPFK